MPYRLLFRLLPALFAKRSRCPSAELRLLLGGLAGAFVFAAPAAPLLAKYLVMGLTLIWLAPARDATLCRGLWGAGLGLVALGLLLEGGTLLLER